jgi:mRNA interferase MazF
MPTFDRGDIVAVPFPYVEYPVGKNRPALVIATNLGPDRSLLWVLMITSVANESWPGDVPIRTGQDSSGLRAASVVRTAKVATIEARVARSVGKLDKANLRDVDAELATAFGG